MINGLRVKQARELRNITQRELAQRVGVSQSTIARMEADFREWPEALVQSIALQTGFPVSFFTQGIGPEFPLGSLLFRCRASLAASHKARLRQFAMLIFELTEKLSLRIRPIPLNLPSFDGENPEEAARVTRTTLGFSPDAPIPHLIDKLERNGVFVLAVPGPIDKFDAFSLWSDGDPRRPILVVSDGKPGDRLRMSCAHELGHLVLHRSPRGSLVEIEKQAYRFAAEFLMPREAILQEIERPVTLTNLARLKPRWGVAIQALLRRGFELSVITKGQFEYLSEQIARMKWRVREPANLDVPPEKPRLVRQLAEMSYGTPPNKERLASLIGAPVGLIEEILAAHAGKSDLPSAEPEVLSRKSATQEQATPSTNVLNFAIRKNG